MCQSCDLAKSLKPFTDGSVLRKTPIIPNGEVVEIKYDRCLERGLARELAVQGSSPCHRGRGFPHVGKAATKDYSGLAICPREGNELKPQAFPLSPLLPIPLAAVLAPFRRSPGGGQSFESKQGRDGVGRTLCLRLGAGRRGKDVPPGSAEIRRTRRQLPFRQSESELFPRPARETPLRGPGAPGAGLGEERRFRAPIAGLLRLRARFEIPR